MFSAPPIDFAETDLGYVGSQHKFLLKIPEGQVTIDAKRGQVFIISGTSVTDISGFGSGMNRFLTDNLDFEILKYAKKQVEQKEEEIMDLKDRLVGLGQAKEMEKEMLQKELNNLKNEIHDLRERYDAENSELST